MPDRAAASPAVASAVPAAARQAVALRTAAGLRAFATHISHTPVMVGFDGFVDSIIQVVDKRQDHDHYQPIPTIDQFGKRIAAAAGHSSNYELVTKLQKLGGNGPIMANALASAGFAVTYVGALGHPALHPAFEELAKRARVYSIAQPGFTDALEFNDGKLMLGKYAHMAGINQRQIDEVLGEEKYRHIIAQSKLIGIVNWTMLPGVDSIWDTLSQRILPELDGCDDRWAFIDLADPAKRTDDDIRRAMQRIAKLNKSIRVVLGLNFAESRQVAQVMEMNVSDEEANIEADTVALREKLKLHAVVVHPRRGAAAAMETGGRVVSGCFHGPFVREPKLSTGAGDNFNAGFCLGLLAGLNVDESLCAGTATSGYYVRNAKSPTLNELAAFCDDLPEPQGD